MTELTYDNITQPIEEWALDYGIPAHLIRNRLRKGWSVERAITEPMRTTPGERLKENEAPEQPKPCALYTYNGRTLTPREWAEETGLKIEVIYNRAKRGMPLDAPCREFMRVYHYNGRSLPIHQWAKELGINKSTLNSRLRSGCSFEKAVTFDGRAQLYEHNGRKMTLRDWAQELGTTPRNIRRRIKKCGMSFEEAITKPFYKPGKYARNTVKQHENSATIHH
jgi:hypothetical protein